MLRLYRTKTPMNIFKKGTYFQNFPKQVSRVVIAIDTHKILVKNYTDIRDIYQSKKYLCRND
jgi:hypothetical protein